MARELLRELGSLTIFMICAQLLVYFRPKESYEKYLKLLMSALILIQFLLPIQKVFGGKGMELEQYWRELQEQFDSSYEKGEEWNQPKQEIPGEEWGENEITVEIPAVEEIQILDIWTGGENEP